MKNTKQTSKHTAGEWVCVELGDFIDTQYGIFQKKNTKNALLARVSSEANARLIASAPELLEQCQRLLNVVESDKRLKAIYHNVVRQSRETIKKAKGE